MPYIHDDFTRPGYRPRRTIPLRTYILGVLLIILITVIAAILTDDPAHLPDETSPDIAAITEPVATTVPVVADIVPPQESIVYEQCEEDEILVPVTYGNPTHYACFVLDDFADPASIARLDALMETRR